LLLASDRIKEMKKGFTIIELLVVVAIISLLTSVVVIVIDVYRARSSNASIQATLGQVRSESLLYRENNTGSFGGMCTAGAPYMISAMFAQAHLQAGATGVCYAGESTWVMAIPLKAGGEGYAWCVDSANYGGPINQARFDILSVSTLCQ
jgi:prepilin-type N-terminal cleavage/methylation domain-containing protein